MLFSKDSYPELDFGAKDMDPAGNLHADNDQIGVLSLDPVALSRK